MVTLLPPASATEQQEQSLAQTFYGEDFSFPLQVKQAEMWGLVLIKWPQSVPKGHTTEVWVLGQLLNPMHTGKRVLGTQN